MKYRSKNREDKMIKISVIVPVYNVEKYIRENIESLTYESDKDIEFIFIDDGSTDRSADIIKEYAEKDSRICLLSKTNSGQASARNMGIRKAQGEYILFVDSDDCINKGVLGELYKIASEKKLDVLQFPFEKIDEEGNEVPLTEDDKLFCNNPKDEVLNGKKWLIKNKVFSVVWIFLYRRQYIIDNELFFIEGHVHEDGEYVPRSVINAKSIMFTDICVCKYRQRPGSTMTRKDEKKIIDTFFIMRKIEELNNKCNDLDVYNGFFRGYIEEGYARHINDTLRANRSFENICLKYKNLIKEDPIDLYNHSKEVLIRSDKPKYRFIGSVLKYRLLWLYKIILKLTDEIRGIA